MSAVDEELRVLLLEDVPADAELALRRLRSDGLPHIATIVAREAEYIDALGAGGFDLILADFHLPDFDGHKALALASERLPDVPFIFVTGTLGDEKAVETLHLGAADYVLKDSLARLAPAIRRAMAGVQARKERVAARVELLAALDAARASEAKFRRLVESSPDLVSRRDTEMRLDYANPALLRFLGKHAGEVTGTSFAGMDLPEVFASGYRSCFAAALTERTVRTTDLHYPTDDHDVIFEVQMIPEIADDGSVHHVVTVARDVTARVHAVEDVRAQEARFRAVTDNASDGIFGTDGEGKITYANPAGWKLFGFDSMEAVRGRHFTEFLAAEAMDDVVARWADTIGAGVPANNEPFETRVMRADGKPLDVEVSVASWLEDGRTRLVGMFRDVSERRARERELTSAHASLRRVDSDRQKLLARLVRAQEEERKLISQDVHDDSIQVMSAAALRLRSLERSLKGRVNAEVLGATAAAVEMAILRLRRLMFELRPPALDRDGLVAVLRNYLSSMSAPFRYDLIDELASDPDAMITGSIYRIIQEALTNVRRHAHAQLVTITVRTADDGVQVSIQDDGIGFDAGEVMARGDANQHIGLVTMRERAELGGGRWSVTSEAGKGTLIEFWVPAQMSLLEAS